MIIWLFTLLFFGPLKDKGGHIYDYNRDLILTDYKGNQLLCLNKSFQSNKNAELNNVDLLFSHYSSNPTINHIPVVVHIIYDPNLAPNDTQYPDDTSINAGIDWINNLLSGNSVCPGSPPSIETGIRLCLATSNIHGQSTKAINRFPNQLTDMDLCRDDKALKTIPRVTLDSFPNTNYLNIYIVREICASCQPLDCLAGGFAAYPAAHGTIYDGIVLEAKSWMNPDCDIRKAIIHELGHYFNLRHTWEGGCKNDNCLSDGDRVCDTPPDADKNFYPSNPCFQNLTVNSCSSDVNPGDLNNPFNSDQLDATGNFMDYAPSKCQYEFTPGQVFRMNQAIEGPRASLLESKGCDVPCQNPISINVDWPESPVLFGNQVTLVNSSLNATSYLWTWFGGSSSSQNLTFTADSTGAFEICVSAFSGTEIVCNKTECKKITVVCTEITPDFQLSSNHINVGESVQLVQTSIIESGFTYEWYINDTLSGQGPLINYFPIYDGSYEVWLQACGNNCCQKSDPVYFSVGYCPTGREANHWLFGRDSIHLNWNSGLPVEQVSSSCKSDEAMAVAVNSNGELLFYSNAEKVFSKDGSQMPNGYLLFVNNSVTHSITIPMPGSDSLWYLFYPQEYDSANPNKDTTTELFYAIVDMSLNGGLGDVILKNQNLLEPSTEKVAITRHCNGSDWWVLGHEAGTNRFFTWLLDRNGLHPPVISSVGLAKSKTTVTKAGELNFSPNGLIIAMSTGPDVNFETFPAWTVELFDFDPSSGLVSNGYEVGTFARDNGKSAYGIEFSNSSQLLYVAFAAFLDTLFQYDLSSKNPATIRNSKNEIYISNTSSDSQFGAMLTGPDGKIYIANLDLPYLSSIENPDILGNGCNFINQAVTFPRGECFLGLPTFPAGIYTPGKPWLMGPSSICDTIKEVKYFVTGNCRFQNYDWEIVGSSKINKTQGDTVWIQPGYAGIDQLIVTKYTACSTLFDTLDIKIEPCDTNSLPCVIPFTWNEADTIVCRGENAWLSFQTQAEIVKYVLASDGILRTLESSTFTISKLQSDEKVTIYLQSIIGCDTQFVVNIHVNPPLDFNLSYADTLICSGETAMISFESSPTNLVELFPENLVYVITNPTWPLSIGPLTSDTTLYVRIRNEIMDCDSIYKWNIKIDSGDKIQSDSVIICEGDSISVSGIWFRRDTLLQRFVSLPGCDSIYSLRISHFPKLKVEVVTHNPCKTNNGFITLIPSNGIPPYQYSLNSGPWQSEASFSHLNEGDYDLDIVDNRGCHYDTLVTLSNVNSLDDIAFQIINASCNANNGGIIIHSGLQNLLFSINSGPLQTDSVFLGLPAGVFDIATISSEGCTDSSQIIIPQLGSPLITSVLSAPEHCEQKDGILNIDLFSGGVPPYFFQIENNSVSSSPIFQDLIAGSYTLNIEDSNGCRDTVLAFVEEEDGPLISSIDIYPDYCGLSVGELSINTNSPGPLSFHLDPFSSLNGHFDNLHSGYYSLEVKDTFGCLLLKDIVIPDSFSFSISKIQTIPSGCNKSEGIIEITTTGNEVKIIINEFPGQEWTSPISGLPDGTYNLKLKDIYNCVIDTTVYIVANCEIDLANVFSPNGDQINDIFGVTPNLVFTKWQLIVFDRSGNMIFSSRDSLNGWDGTKENKACQSGVYTWILEYGLPGINTSHFKKGDVTLLR